MVKVCVCLDTVLSEYSFEDRIRKVAELGFDAFEFWYIDYWFDGENLIPREKDVNTIATIAKDNNIMLSDILLNSWDGVIGGSLVKPADKHLYMKRLRNMVSIAHKLDCQKLITLTGKFIAVSYTHLTLPTN